MIKITKHLAIICTALAAGLLSRPACSDHDLDLEYAQHLPLVADSMLLDITRVGDTLVAVGERGHVVTSTDGKTWVQAEVVPTRSTLTTVFSDGQRLWAGGHDAVILTSGDAGNTWTRQFFDTHRQQAVMDIYFSDEENGVAIGSYGLYLRTSNGGHSWEDYIVDEEIDYHLNSLLAFDDERWLIAGEAGYSYRSYDGGNTWEPVEVPYLGSMWGSLRSSSECVIFYGLRGHVMESCDFGTTWTEIPTGSEASISGAVEENGLVLLAANSGMILTRDDDKAFRVHHHPSGVDFSAALALGEGNFLLTGEDGIHRYPHKVEEGEGND
jgi:photosystem II stability/assembly factor-like uncharacterized protein